MDIKDYIASGVVEMYALGVLPESEKNEFEQKLSTHSELARELNQVQRAIHGYANAYAVNPRPSLRAGILNNSKGTRSSAEEKNKKYSADRNHTLTYKYLIAASLAALAISTFASWFFYSRWEDSEERFSELLSEKNQLAQNYNLVKDSFDKTLYDVLVMRDEHSQVIPLLSADTSIKYSARIYWNELSKETFLDVLRLPDPGQDHQYHLWAYVNGEPVDAGFFVVHEFSGIQRMREIPVFDSWTVNLEPKGGSPVPLKEEQVLVSKAKDFKQDQKRIN